MPHYKIHYFDITALGELLRMILAYGDEEFDDVRIQQDEWPALKPSYPMGQLPVMDIDGKRVHQTIPMARYLAKQVKLVGKDDWEDLQIDIAVDTLNDLRLKIGGAAYEPDEEIKAKKMETVKKEIIPFYLEKLDKMAKDNKGHFVGNKITWADVYLTAILPYLNFITQLNLTENWANLQEVVSNVEANPNIKKWIENRPKTPF